MILRRLLQTTNSYQYIVANKNAFYYVTYYKEK